jgi:DNA-binding CsgD family transcriptional regulator
MMSGSALSNLTSAVIDDCRSGLDADALRLAIVPRLRRVVPIDALWWACADPATLLFTRSHREELPESSGPYFVENEYLHDDVNKWTELAQHPDGAATLMSATGGDPYRSDRFRDIFAPLGLQDELRAVLRLAGQSWGYLCLHRGTARATFSEDEVRFIRLLAPHIAEGIRAGLLRQACGLENVATAPGLIVLAADGSLVSSNAAAGAWLEDLGGRADGTHLPVEILAVAARLRHLSLADAALPRLQVRTESGQWAILHSSWMTGPAGAHVAVIIERASADDVAPTIMAAYGLTDRERVITALVCQGLSTRVISERLHVTPDTVQDHLKSVFDRVGVHSRGELVATILRREYLPHAAKGEPLNRSGSFAVAP